MNNSIDIINEVQTNFIESSVDTNCNRAFPNVADGLKPGMRAILWEMYTKKYLSSKPHVKSAKIDGGVAALWWPHGTVAIYETFARMSQSFTNNVPLVDFHGANGNIILGGDAIASDRYTEARLSKICEEGMLKGISKNNVSMQLNFSEDEEWPVLLPAVFPNLLVNGAQGIGVGIANVWVPHSFTETGNLILDYLKTGELDEDNYYPDFPSGGVIVNKNELSLINKTGKGKVVVQGRYKIKEQEIIFYEMPYQVYIEPVIEKIKEQIEKGNLTGIADVLNKSDKNNIALVIECEKDVNPEKVVDLLFATTPLQSQYNANQNGIISKTPILLTLKQTVDCYINHNITCIRREHEYDFEKTSTRIEILKGMLLALTNIDKVVHIVKNSDYPKEDLMSDIKLTESQAKAVLDMKLSKLSKLESQKLKDELKKKEEYATYCKEVIESEDKQKEILINRLSELVKKFGDERRTEVCQKEIKKISTSKSKTKTEEISQDIVVVHTDNGYIKAIPLTQYKQLKGNAGNSFKCTTKDIIYCFSSLGKMYRITAKDIGLCGNADKGKAFGAILKLDPKETILFVTSAEVNEKHPYITAVTDNGLVKKMAKIDILSSMRNINGIKYMGLSDNKIIFVCESNGDILTIKSTDNYVISFKLDEVRTTGKTSKGVKGITLNPNQTVQFVELNNPPKGISLQKRGGKGKQCQK